jgi:hypothetical protein
MLRNQTSENMKNTILVLLLIIGFLSQPANCLGQQKKTIGHFETEKVSLMKIEWTQYFKNDILSISYRTIICPGKNPDSNSEFLVLKVENISNKDYTVQWNNILFNNTQQYPQNPKGQESFRTISLLKNSNQEGDCYPSELRIFIKSFSGEDTFNINSFRLADLSVQEFDKK